MKQLSHAQFYAGPLGFLVCPHWDLQLTTVSKMVRIVLDARLILCPPMERGTALGMVGRCSATPTRHGRGLSSQSLGKEFLVVAPTRLMFGCCGAFWVVSGSRDHPQLSLRLCCP